MNKVIVAGAAILVAVLLTCACGMTETQPVDEIESTSQPEGVPLLPPETDPPGAEVPAEAPDNALAEELARQFLALPYEKQNEVFTELILELGAEVRVAVFVVIPDDMGDEWPDRVVVDVFEEMLLYVDAEYLVSLFNDLVAGQSEAPFSPGAEVPAEEPSVIDTLQVVLVEMNQIDSDSTWKYYEAHFAIENRSDQSLVPPKEWGRAKGVVYAGEYEYEVTARFDIVYVDAYQDSIAIPPNVRIRGDRPPYGQTSTRCSVEFKAAAALIPTGLHLDGVGNFDLLNPMTDLTYPLIEEGKTELLEFPANATIRETRQIIEEQSQGGFVIETTNLSGGHEGKMSSPFLSPMFVGRSGVPSLRYLYGASGYWWLDPLGPGVSVYDTWDAAEPGSIFFANVRRDEGIVSEAYIPRGNN